MITASPAIGGILFYDGCDKPFDTSYWNPQGTWKNYPDKRYGWVEPSKEQARAGEGSYKFTLKPSNTNNCSDSTCKHVQLATRVPGLKPISYNKEYWIGFSLYFPKNFQPPSERGFWINFFDSHQVPDTNDFPINLVDTVSEPGTYFQFRIQGDSRKTTPAYDNQIRKKFYRVLPPTTDRWHDFVLHFKFDNNPNNNPFFKCYINGELVINDSGINCTYDDKGPFLKFGLYGNVQNETIVYYDEFRFGNSTSSYAEVAPRGGNSLLPSPNLKIITTK